MDDDPDSDGGDYESDDGFVVADSDDVTDDHGNDDEYDEFVPEDNTDGVEAATTTASSGRSVERASLSIQRPVFDSDDSDDASLPELSVIMGDTSVHSSALQSGSIRRSRKLVIDSDTEKDSEEMATPTRRSAANASHQPKKDAPIARGNEQAARMDDAPSQSLALQSPLGAVDISGVGTHAAPVAVESDSDVPSTSVRRRRATFPRRSLDAPTSPPSGEIRSTRNFTEKTPATRKKKQEAL
jgi:hypothetical protein